MNLDEAIKKIRSKSRTKRWLHYIYYRDYIKSHYWEEKKLQKLKINPICECCWWEVQCVHHETYHRLWKERMEDLRSLCNQCHYDIHFIYNKNKNTKQPLLKAFHTLRVSKWIFNYWWKLKKDLQ